MTRQLTSIALAFTLASLVVGCEKQPAAPTAAPQAKKAVTKPAEVKPTSPEAPPPPKYTYDPAGRRDPFVPLVLAAKKAAPTAQGGAEIVPLEPLQRYELDQLRLIGIVMVKPQPIAMVAAPDGKSYILKRGVKLGKNNGSVIAITIDAVVVKEEYLDISGETRSATVEIKLPKKEGV